MLSQVATILVGSDEIGQLNGRDVIAQTINRALVNVQDVVGYYHPLQYMLLVPYKTNDQDINTHSDNGRRVT